MDWAVFFIRRGPHKREDSLWSARSARMTQGMWIGGSLPASMPLFYACHLITQPLPSLYFPARVICGGELQFYPTAAILLEIGKIFQITGGQDVQPETSWILSWKQARFRVTDRWGKFLDGIDEEIIIKVQIFSAVFDIITLLEKTGEPGGIWYIERISVRWINTRLSLSMTRKRL